LKTVHALNGKLDTSRHDMTRHVSSILA